MALWEHFQPGRFLRLVNGIYCQKQKGTSTHWTWNTKLQSQKKGGVWFQSISSRLLTLWCVYKCRVNMELLLNVQEWCFLCSHWAALSLRNPTEKIELENQGRVAAVDSIFLNMLYSGREEERRRTGYFLPL